MTILFSCISRGTTVLCSQQEGVGNFKNIADSMLPNIPTRKDGKTTYASNNYSFHCLIDNGIIYLCAAAPEFGKQQPYAFLTEIRKRFQSGPLVRLAPTAGTNDFDQEFGFILSSQMEKFSKPGTGSDSYNKLQSQVDEVKDVMSQNIEKVMERGDRLDDLMDKTDELEASSASFQKTAGRIRKKYWWKNTKMTMILVGVTLLVIIIIIIIILASTGVFKKSSSDNSVPSGTTKKP